MDASGEARYRFDCFQVDGGARLLLRDGQPVALAPKAFDLLCYLLAHAHRLLSKAELLKGVWPRGFVEEGNLSHNIFLLRRALGESPEEHRYIVTVPGRGYKFVGRVQAVEPAAAPGAMPAALPDALSAALGVTLGGGRPGQGPQQVYSITAGDFNGDGKLDLAVVNQLDGTVSVLLNATEPGGDRLSFAPPVQLKPQASREDQPEGERGPAAK
jgi:DNA-binding winged helix-turn-helix (wHTH) protein